MLSLCKLFLFKMKIFQVITLSEYGGAQSVVQNLSQAFSADNEVFVLYGGNGDAWENINGNIKKIRTNKHRKELSIKDIFLFLRLIYYRIKFRPDIVHLHSSKMGVLGRIVFSPAKTIYTLHGFDSVRLAHRKFLFIEKLLKNRAAKIVAVSQYDVEGLKEENIFKNVELIYNGLIDYTNLSDHYKYDERLLTQIQDIKQNYNRTIMCISRVSKQKKFELFLDIAESMPQYAFVWIGNKEPMSGLPANVFCLGEAAFAHIYLKYADLFILPSNYEGLPVSILEALSYSVPVVASAVGGIPEILNGDNGFCVSNDVLSFKEKIEYSLKEENHKRMTAAARKSYEQNFTIDKMVNGYKAIYTSIYKK